MGTGHRLTTGTVGLWRMDEQFAHLVGADIDEGFAPQTGATSAYPYITDYSPIPGTYCRKVGGSADGSNVYRFCAFDFTGSAGDLAACKADLTCEIFMRVQAGGLNGMDSPIFMHGTVNTLQANNIPFSWFINATGSMKAVWENGANLQNTFTCTNHGNLIDNQWHHLAVSVERSTKMLRFYVDGVNTDSFNYTNEPTDGTATNQWFLFTDDSDETGTNARGFNTAYARSFRFSNIVRSGSEISASAMLMTTTGRHTVDANTRHTYDFTAQPCFLDHSGFGHHATRLSGAGSGILSITTSGTHPRGGLIGDGGRCTYNEEMCYRVGYSPTLQTAFVGENTFEIWAILTPFATSPPTLNFGLLALGGMDTGEGELQAHNHYHYVITPSLQMQVNWETGSGTENTYTCTNAVIEYGKLYHLAFRKRIVTGSSFVDFFINGQKIEQSGPITNYPSGGGTTFVFGCRLLSANNGQGWTGFADDIRFSNLARTDAEILESYQRGLGAIPPVIEDTTPAPGLITTTTAITASITDADSGLTSGSYTIFALYGSDYIDGQIAEGVFVSGAFQPGFDSLSTISGSQSGSATTFVIRRDNGWPSATASLVIQAIDVDNNSAVRTFNYTTDFTGSVDPVVSFTPIVGTLPASGTLSAITASITDTNGNLFNILAYATYDSGRTELIYNSLTGTFFSPYDSSSSHGPITNGRQLIIARSSSWGSISGTLTVVGIDTTGRRHTATASFVTDFVYPLTGDMVRPVIINFTPLTGSNISGSQVVQFDCLDNLGSGSIRRTLLHAAYATINGSEVVHDGENFNSRHYSGTENSRVTVTGSGLYEGYSGYRFRVIRDGGWPNAAPVFFPFIIDTAGNENS